MTDARDTKPMDRLIDSREMADALRTDRFRQFLDHIPVAIAVSELLPAERVTYANLEFERLTRQSVRDIEGRTWSEVPLITEFAEQLNRMVASDDDYVGRTAGKNADGSTTPIDLWANVILDDDGAPLFRIVAGAPTTPRDLVERDEHARRMREKDTLMRELQHRVTNNLQMITTLIRLEARSLPPDAPDDPFTRLAGRVASLAVLYRLLSDDTASDGVDLGAYLSQIASTIMEAHATAGVRLDLKVDSWPVSVNVAMPTGLIVNELLTNALKHAFDGRDGGTVTLHSLVDDESCTVIVADDGRGMPEGEHWPRRGKLGFLIAQSLRESAGADIEVSSTPGSGTSVTIRFSRFMAAPAND